MKTLIILITFLTSILAQAEEVLVYETSDAFARDMMSQSAGFDYDKKEGSAKLFVKSIGREICVPTDYGSCHTEVDVQLHQVEGLYFDRNVGKRGAVLYDAGDEQIVCAYRRLLWGPKPTGLCRIELVPQAQGIYHLRLFVDL